MLIQWFQVDPLDAGVLFDPVPEGGDTAVHGRPESVTISGHPRKHTDLNHVPITEAEQWTARITLVKLGITFHHEECYQWSISQTTDIIISASRNQFTCAYNSKYPLIQSCHKFEHATTSAVVTCAKFWLGQIIILHAIATRFLHEVNWRSNFTWITVARLNDSILADTQRKNNVIMTPRPRHNDVIITSRACWDASLAVTVTTFRTPPPHTHTQHTHTHTHSFSS